MRAASFLIALVLAVVSACNRTAPTPPTVAAGRAASYQYEVRGAGGAHQRGEAETFTVTAGANTVSVQDGRLTVNGKGYDRLKDGDAILVDEGGQVSVNGTARSPH